MNLWEATYSTFTFVTSILSWSHRFKRSRKYYCFFFSCDLTFHLYVGRVDSFVRTTSYCIWGFTGRQQPVTQTCLRGKYIVGASKVMCISFIQVRTKNCYVRCHHFNKSSWPFQTTKWPFSLRNSFDRIMFTYCPTDLGVLKSRYFMLSSLSNMAKSIPSNFWSS